MILLRWTTPQQMKLPRMTLWPTKPRRTTPRQTTIRQAPEGQVGSQFKKHH